MKNENLTKKLKDWNANIAPDKSRNAKIKEKIMKNLDKPVKNMEFKFEDPYFHIHKKVLYFAGIAASVCFAFLLGTQFNNPQEINPQMISNNSSPSKALFTLTDDEIRNLKKISSEIDNLFPEGVRMLSQVNDGDLQIDTNEKKAIESKEKVLLRYIVLKKDAEDGKWKKVHVSNVIASAGEPIELKGKNSGHLWIYPADDNVYAIESNLQIHANGEIINLNYTGGQELRTPQNIKAITNGDTEYKVYQTLVRI